MRVSSAEFIKNFGAVTDSALTEPVTITRNGRPRLVLLSAEEFERLKRRDRRAYFASEIGDEELALIENYEVGDRNAHLDEELKDGKS